MRCGQINGPASQAIVRPKINFYVFRSTGINLYNYVLYLTYVCTKTAASSHDPRLILPRVACRPTSTTATMTTSTTTTTMVPEDHAEHLDNNRTTTTTKYLLKSNNLNKQKIY